MAPVLPPPTGVRGLGGPSCGLPGGIGATLGRALAPGGRLGVRAWSPYWPGARDPRMGSLGGPPAAGGAGGGSSAAGMYGCGVTFGAPGSRLLMPGPRAPEGVRAAWALAGGTPSAAVLCPPHAWVPARSGHGTEHPGPAAGGLACRPVPQTRSMSGRLPSLVRGVRSRPGARGPSWALAYVFRDPRLPSTLSATQSRHQSAKVPVRNLCTATLC